MRATIRTLIAVADSSNNETLPIHQPTIQVLSTTGEMAGADDGAPWYVYAGALAALLAFSKVATNIASEALADIEDE